MATSKTEKTKSKVKTAVQEALEVTWVLKGHLKNMQIAYIRVGVLLAKVRDKKLYAELKHPDMESYAQERLQLGRASLYRYLQVHDWIGQYHKAWLEPKPKGFIPNLSDATDLIWVEEELARKGLDSKRKAGLKDLQKKALEGKLTEGEVDAFRRKRGGEDGLKSFLSKLKVLRMRGSQLASMPDEATSHLDAAIDIIKNAAAGQKTGT